MAGQHGGAREGSGRKKTREKYEGQVNAAEQRIADRLPQIIDNLFHLADGGYARVKEKFERTEKRDTKGRIVRDEQDNPIMELVCVERTVEIADKDRAANIALLERILGKPAQSHELETEEGETVPFAIVRLPVKVSPEEWQQQAQEHAKNASKPNATSESPS